MLTSRQAWDVLVARAPRNEWLKLRDLYSVVAAHVELDEQDRAPVAARGTSARWQRTVRNALQRQKQLSDIEWDRKEGFRFPD